MAKLTHRCARTLALIFFSFIAVHSAFSQNQISIDDTRFQDALTQHQQVIVTVRFDDVSVGRNVARGFEPLASNYEQGYITLVLDREEFDTLKAATDTLPISVEYDVKGMQDYLINSTQQRLNKSAERGSTNDPNNGVSLTPNVTAQSFNDVVYPSIPGFSCYRTVEGTYSTAQDIVAAFPNLASWADVGDSWEKTVGQGGFDIQALTLTNSAISGPKPAILMTGGIHAREYTPVELLTRFAEHLVTSYGSDADVTWILDNHIVHIIPIANPDGRKRAETGLLWRKNVNENYCGATSDTRGADLNRNFQFAWGCCGGSSANQCSQTYRGPFAASEPETQAVQNFLINNFADNRGPNISDAAPLSTQGMYIDIHSSGQFVLWPWGFSATPTPNGTALQTLGRKLAFPTGYSPEQAASSFTTDGETDSFGYGELGLPSYTFELGTQFFEACSLFENTIVPDNFQTLTYALKVLREPYVTPAGPDSFNLGLSISSAVPAGTAVDITANVSDTRFNNSNGAEPTQNIANAEYYIDVPPWGNSPLALPLNASDGAFNSSSEAVNASIDTSTLSQGQHTIFVRAQDVSGTWGAISAVFLDIDNSAPVPVNLFVDDFETSLGWTTNANGADTATTGQWERGDPEEVIYQGVFTQLPDSVSGNNNLVTGRLRGSGVGSFDIDSGVTSIRSPDIVIPADAQSVTLSLSQYFYHSSNSSNADFLSISVVGNTTSVVLDERGTNSVRAAQWVPFSADLSSFAGQTVHLLIQAADASNGSLVEAGIDDVVISAIVSAPSNQAPNVDAGPDQSISLPATATLAGSATDDGLPSTTLSTNWSQVSGPGTATFTNAAAPTTTASFSVEGTYVLRLSADDGDLSNSDDISINVAPQNQAPTVDAGSDQAITLPSSATLIGSASDDGEPSDSLTTLWSQISGPGSVSFINANALTTEANFSAAGSYTLRLTADDGDLSSDSDVVITVNPAPPINQAPTVNAGADQSITLPSNTTLIGTASDDGLPSSTLTTAWSQISGPGIASFANPASASTAVSFSNSGTYVLSLTANDSALSASDNIVVTVNPVPPVNQAPTVNAGADQTITLPSNAALIGTASDDGLPSASLGTLWSQVSGPGAASFANAASPSTSVNFSNSGTYVLRLTASDTALNSSDDVIITVNPAPPVNQAPTVDAGANLTITLPATAALAGSASDDGLPNNTLSNLWSVLSGPGAVTFANNAALNTSATFSAAGNYVLRLTATDGALSSVDDLTVQVDPAPTSDNFETLVLTKINTTWEPVSFANSYTDPVVVCTPQYLSNELPAVVRVRNVNGSGFEVKTQNPSNSTLNDLPVFCVAMESGNWTLPDGRLIEAQTYNSTVTNRSGAWTGQAQSYLNSYTAPVVLGQVMTENDTDWSTFWSYGASRASAPNSSTLITGKQVAEDSDTTRANETVGFIVLEGGTGTVAGTAYTAQTGADSITGATNSTTSYNFSSAFSSTPAFAVASMAGLDGGNGGWVFLDGFAPITNSGITFAVDEDQIRDSERSHITEQVSYLVFESSVSLSLTPAP